MTLFNLLMRLWQCYMPVDRGYQPEFVNFRYPFKLFNFTVIESPDKELQIVQAVLERAGIL